MNLAVEDQTENWVDLKGEKISAKGAAAQLKIGVSLLKVRHAFQTEIRDVKNRSVAEKLSY